MAALSTNLIRPMNSVDSTVYPRFSIGNMTIEKKIATTASQSLTFFTISHSIEPSRVESNPISSKEVLQWLEKEKPFHFVDSQKTGNELFKFLCDTMPDQRTFFERLLIYLAPIEHDRISASRGFFQIKRDFDICEHLCKTTSFREIESIIGRYSPFWHIDSIEKGEKLLSHFRSIHQSYGDVFLINFWLKAAENGELKCMINNSSTFEPFITWVDNEEMAYMTEAGSEMLRRYRRFKKYLEVPPGTLTLPSSFFNSQLYVEMLFEELSGLGNLDRLQQLINQQITREVVPSIDSIKRAMLKAVSMGWEQIVEYLIFYDKEIRQTSVLTSTENMNLFINLALDHGYFKVVEKIPHTRSHAQEKLYRDLKETDLRMRLNQTLFPPAPFNKIHREIHTQSFNWIPFTQSYRKQVSTAIALLKNNKRPIDVFWNLGLCRRRMVFDIQNDAILSSPARDLYGAYQNGVWHISTPYDTGTYLEYGEKIKRRYTTTPPLQVVAHIGETPVLLSAFRNTCWTHPLNTNRETIFKRLEELFDEFQKTPLSNNTEGWNRALKMLAEPLFLMAHAPAFMRGNPTVLHIMIDALLIIKFDASLDKKDLKKRGIELNCEALSYSNVDDFYDEMMSRATLIRNKEYPLKRTDSSDSAMTRVFSNLSIFDHIKNYLNLDERELFHGALQASSKI